MAQEKPTSLADTLPSSVTDHPEQVLSQNAAAIRIQSAMRGYSARRRLQPYIQKHKAATVIQAAWYVHEKPAQLLAIGL